MAKGPEVDGTTQDKLFRVFGQALSVIVEVAVRKALAERKPEVSTGDPSAKERPSRPGPAQPVTPPPEEDVTEEVIRTRAADVCQLDPKTGKTAVVEVIKKIGGGKIADLKTPKQRVACLEALDELYTRLSNGTADEGM